MTLAESISECLSEWIAEHGTDDCGGPCAVTSSVVALRTVLGLHRRHDPNPANALSPYVCRADGEPYPCQTVQAIAAPMGISEES